MVFMQAKIGGKDHIALFEFVYTDRFHFAHVMILREYRLISAESEKPELLNA